MEATTEQHDVPTILAVDDTPVNLSLITGLLKSHYRVKVANSGEKALRIVHSDLPPDLVLLDVMMPGIDGVETVRRIKADASLPFFPVVLLTARSETTDIVAGLEAGADDYLTKPIWHTALLARVVAMLRIKALQDDVTRQAADLATWNAQLERRVAAQVAAIERIERLKRFLAPQVVQAILQSADTGAELLSHRRDVAVLFCDLRGFTAFAEAAEPETIVATLREYHEVVGALVVRHGGTLERFVGDAIMVYFNDPLPSVDYCDHAAALALDIIATGATLTSGWRRRGVELNLGIGIAAGNAMLGVIGFDQRVDYAAIGTVTNLASRLSARAAGGQILVNDRFADTVTPRFTTTLLGPRDLHGFSRPVSVYELSS